MNTPQPTEVETAIVNLAAKLKSRNHLKEKEITGIEKLKVEIERLAKGLGAWTEEDLKAAQVGKVDPCLP